MKEARAVIYLFEKYDFQKNIPADVRKIILKSRKEVFSTIMKANNVSFLMRLASKLQIFLKGMNIDFSVNASRNFLAAATACFLVIALGTGAYFSGIFTGSMNPDEKKFIVKENSGKAMFIAGEVLVIRGTSTKPLVQGEDVVKGDVIRTSEKAFAVIQLIHSGVLKIHENTELAINSLDPAGQTELRLEKGVVFSKVNKLMKNSSYEIRTNTYTAAVRGTQFLVKNNDNEKEVHVLDGKVNVRNDNGENDLESLDGVKISNDGVRKAFSLDKIQELTIKRDAVYDYEDNLAELSKKDLNAKAVEIQKIDDQMSAEIQVLEKAKEELENMKPLDRLRAMGKPLTMLYLRDGSQIAGMVEKSDAKSIYLNTGEGIVKLPVDEIIRRFPMK